VFDFIFYSGRNELPPVPVVHEKMQPQASLEHNMTNPKPDVESDAARTGKDADKNRDELVKKAEQSVAGSKNKSSKKPA